MLICKAKIHVDNVMYSKPTLLIEHVLQELLSLKKIMKMAKTSLPVLS